MKVEILSPSYRRPEIATTQEYLPSCIYVVAQSEKRQYEKHGRKVIAVPNTVQGNVCRVRNWILERFNPVLILDDDIRRFGRWNKQQNQKLDTDEAMEFIEQAFNLARQLGARVWGMNLLSDKDAYVEHRPFAFRSVVLGPVQGFVNMDLRYDETLQLKEDYDLSLQVLNKYRRTLRFNYMHCVCSQHSNVGGCAAYRTMARERKQFQLLQKKWGSKIVRIDNPVVRVPIHGV